MPTQPATDLEPPRSARISYVLAAVSLFVPVLLVILLPEIPVVVLLIVENAAVAAALVAIVLAIRVLIAGPAGRVSAVFGVLLGLVSLAYNVPLLLSVWQTPT